MTADRPILFSAPMVRALLDGRKTQTRRVIKPQPIVEPNGAWRWEGRNGGFVGAMGTHVDEGLPESAKAWSQFQTGDRLWVREAWRTLHMWDCLAPRLLPEERHKITYGADPENRNPTWAFGKPRPSIHMPRWASRLTLVVTDVRVQRLQDISEGDAEAEGATSRPNCHGFQDMYSGWSMDWSKVGERSDYATGGPGPLQERDISLGDARMAFANYWGSINGPGAWEANPWVVALTFAAHRCNIDQMEAGQ